MSEAERMIDRYLADPIEYPALRIIGLIEKDVKSFIPFPKSELDSLMARLKAGKPIFTTRIKDERGEYSPGQLVDSPFGILQVKSSDQTTLKDHPFYKNLSDKEKEALSRHKLDIIKLKKYELRAA